MAASTQISLVPLPTQGDPAVSRFNSTVTLIRERFRTHKYEEAVRTAMTLLNCKTTGKGPFRADDPEVKDTMNAAGFKDLHDLLTSPKGFGLENFQVWSRIIKGVNVMERFEYPRNSDIDTVLYEAEEVHPPHHGDIMQISPSEYWRKRAELESTRNLQLKEDYSREVENLQSQLATQKEVRITNEQELISLQGRINTLVSCFHKSAYPQHNDVDSIIDDIVITIDQSNLAEKHELLTRLRAYKKYIPKILKGAQIQKARFEEKKVRFGRLCKALKDSLIKEVRLHKSLRNRLKRVHVCYLSALSSIVLIWILTLLVNQV